MKYYYYIAMSIALASVLPEQVDAQYLPERLAPPQKVEVPALPTSNQPESRKSTKVDQPIGPLWALPYGEFPNKPQSLPTERQGIVWNRPAVDTPELARHVSPTVPSAMVLTTVNGSFVASASPQQVGPLATLPRAAEARPKVNDDPTADSALTAMTATLALPAINPPPLLRLTLPDPFAALRSTAFFEPPSDLDGLEASRLRPAPPTLSVTPVEKKP